MDTTAHIYRERGYYRVLLNVGATKMINSDEICFDKRNLIIRIPTIYDNKRYKISATRVKNAAFTICYDRDPDEDITGKYKIEQDGDEYLLIKKTQTS